MSTSDALVFHDEIELEDFEWDSELYGWTYPCPCGDRFVITPEELEQGEEIATCPSCSLIVRVIYDMDNLPEIPEDTEAKRIKSDSSKNTVAVA